MFARLRAAWRAFWNSTTAAAVPEASPQPVVARATLWEAQVHGGPSFDPVDVFKRPEPLVGVLPAGMALDSLPDMPMFAATSYAQMVSEGLGFLGYAYLAELSQRGEYRKMCAIWADHATRKWVKVTGDKDKVEKINQEMERLQMRDRFRDIVEKDCLFGRSQLALDFGDHEDDRELQAPLIIDPAKINAKRPLKRLAVVEPMWSYPGVYNSLNPLAPDFYRPEAWYVQGRRVHRSRMLTFVGHEVPDMLKPAYAFGGVALTQMAKPYVDNWLRNRQSASDLLNAFSVMVLKTDMEQGLAGTLLGTSLLNRIDAFNKTRNNRGTFVIDKNSEDFANVAAPISGLDKLVAQSQEQMSSISGIPLVVLLGITPSGLNASSEGEIRVFYDAILAYCQKTLRPNLQTLLDVLQLSLFGEIDQTITFDFLPLWEMSDKDKSDIRKSDAEADATYVNVGAVSPEEVRERLNDEDGGMYHGLLDGDAPEPPDEEGGGGDGEGEG
jgi:phage-related protein (TIGR01555 family)